MKATHANEKQQDLKGSDVYVGIDVHLKRWVVTIRFMNMEMKSFSMNPKPQELIDHLARNYAGANCHVVYEAGFCGFWIRDVFDAAGIDCILVHAADVPTTHKQKVTKKDKVDSRKLAKGLEIGTLKAIHIPTKFERKLRSLSRLRDSCTRDLTRVKNRIKSHLYFYGVDLSEISENKHWSAPFIADLEELTKIGDPAALCLRHLLTKLKNERLTLLAIVRDLRKLFREHRKDDLRSLLSVPGVGFITASTFLAEIGDASRFATEDEFTSYIGLVPSTNNTGETQKTGGLTPRKNSLLKHLIIEAAWISIRKDPGLTASFCTYCRRMKKTEAIVRIAAKLLNRMRHVWLHQTTYKIQLVG